MLHWIDYDTLERLCYTGAIMLHWINNVTLGEIMLHWRDYVTLDRLCCTG